MTKFLKIVLVLCTSLSLVGALSSVEAAQEDVDEIIAGVIADIDKYGSGMQEDPDDIIAGAVEYIDKYESGRIAYTYEYESGARGTEMSGKCEVVFEGDNQHVTNKSSNGDLSSRYDYNDNSTQIDEYTRIPVDSTKPPIFVLRAEVSSSCHNVSLHSIIDDYRNIRFTVVYPTREWVLLGTKEENGETVYVLADTTSQGVFKHFLEVVPEKGYYIKESWYHKIGHQPERVGKRFSNPTWNEDAQIYYPGKFVHDLIWEGELSRRTLTQTDVRFNIDFPDETFLVPMQKYGRVIDYRSADKEERPIYARDMYSSSRPDELRRFLNKLNGLSVKEPARSEAMQKPSGVDESGRFLNELNNELNGLRVKEPPRTEPIFADDVLKALNTHLPNSFDGVTVKNKSRMVLRMKEGGKKLDDKMLEQVATVAIHAFQKTFSTSNCTVLISLDDGEILARSRYRHGKFLTRVY